MEKTGKKAREEQSPTEQSPPERPGAFYTWWGEKTEILFSYSKERNKGTLTMNSRKLREEKRDYEKQKEKEKKLKERGF
jgi:hypothetical protein